MKKIIFIFIYTLVFALLGKLIYSEITDIKKEKKQKSIKKCDDAYAYYGDEVEKLAKTFKLPPSYLMALIMLEASGREDVPHRFEKKIYRKLTRLKKGKRSKFEDLTRKDVKKLTDKQLKTLASSHGPFQIMGYKCFFLDIPIDSLVGKKNMYYTAKWINITYGDLLRKGKYKDAFHIHNAGEKFPKDGKSHTHDPKYVTKGLAYMRYFRGKWSKLQVISGK